MGSWRPSRLSRHRRWAAMQASPPPRWRACVIAAAGVLLAGAAPLPGAVALQGRGVQIYDCIAAPGGFAWRLKAPDARLFDARGQDVGHHFAGPSWQAADGSTVVGEVVASSAGAAGAIPWLVLRVKSHAGTGLFGPVTYVVRSQTIGGAAPDGGCDKDHLGAQARVGYSATYTFFPKQDAAKP